jgi:hypothetical protein
MTTVQFRPCNKCGNTYPIENFYKNKARKEGVANYCKTCHQESCAPSSSKGVRLNLIADLGGQCAHCGFKDVRALQIDHKDGGGRLELLASGGMREYYKAMRVNIEKYQVLCANCNWIKRTEDGELLRGAIVHDPVDKSLSTPRHTGRTRLGQKRAPYKITKTDYPKRPYKPRPSMRKKPPEEQPPLL